MSANVFPALNTVLLLMLMALAIWRLRMVDLSALWDEIEAIKLRLAVQEKSSPCRHCRAAHGAHCGSDCDDV